MSDRELIRQTILGPKSWVSAEDEWIAGQVADDILAALEDRLLPDMGTPEFDILTVMIDDAGGWNVSLRKFKEEPYAYGTGNNLVVAIRNAVKEMGE